MKERPHSEGRSNTESAPVQRNTIKSDSPQIVLACGCVYHPDSNHLERCRELLAWERQALSQATSRRSIDTALLRYITHFSNVLRALRPEQVKR